MYADILYERGTGGRLFVLKNVELVDAPAPDGFILIRKDGKTISLNNKFIIQIDLV